MQNHFKYRTRSFMGVYRPHQAKAMLLLDNGSVYGNKSYVQDLDLGQPLNLLSKNRGNCLTAVTKTSVEAFPGDNPYGLLPCNGIFNPGGIERPTVRQIQYKYIQRKEL